MRNTLLFGNRTNPADGLGQLAQALAEGVEGLTASSNTDSISESAVALVHARRNAELLPVLIEHCQRTGQPLLNLGTGFEVSLPENLNFLYIECPNISLEVLGFMDRVQQACEQMEESFFLHITEHHQAAKKDRSGTAVRMINEASGLPLSRNPQGHYHGAITSVRDVAKTRSAGFDIPVEYESGYAIHEASILAANDGQVFEPLEVYGRKTYAEGLQKVLQTLQKIEPITGRLHITDFARDNNLI